MVSPLTSAALRNLKPPAKGTIYFPDGACPGLRLRISSAGKMTWVLNCRDRAGKVRSVALGEYGAGAMIGLSEARERARRERQRLKDGQDVIQERREARAEAERRRLADTLASLVERYEKHVITERQKIGKARAWGESRRAISSVFGRHLDEPLTDLTAPRLQQTIDAWPSRVRAGAAVRFVRPVLKWGAKRGLVDPTIAPLLEQPEGAHPRRQRVLGDEEIAAIWQALDGAGAYGEAFRWLFWTACRKSEMTRARWQHVDLEAATWTVPAEHSKNGRPHVVPLSRQALAMLTERPKEHAPDDLLFPNRAGGELDNMDRATKRLQAVSKTEGWHRHDLRRTAASVMGDLGVSPFTIEVCLGHALGSTVGLSSVARTYNTSRYEREHRDALQMLADRLAAIVGRQCNGVSGAGMSEVMYLPPRALNGADQRAERIIAEWLIKEGLSRNRKAEVQAAEQMAVPLRRIEMHRDAELGRDKRRHGPYAKQKEFADLLRAFIQEPDNSLVLDKMRPEARFLSGVHIWGRQECGGASSQIEADEVALRCLADASATCESMHAAAQTLLRSESFETPERKKDHRTEPSEAAAEIVGIARELLDTLTGRRHGVASVKETGTSPPLLLAQAVIEDTTGMRFEENALATACRRYKVAKKTADAETSR